MLFLVSRLAETNFQPTLLLPTLVSASPDLPLILARNSLRNVEGTIVVEKEYAYRESNLNEKKKKKRKGYVRYSRKKLPTLPSFYLIVTRRDPATMHLGTHVADLIEIFLCSVRYRSSRYL